MIRPFDQFDIEACSILTIVAFQGCNKSAQDQIAAELRDFVGRQGKAHRKWFASFSRWCSRLWPRQRRPVIPSGTDIIIGNTILSNDTGSPIWRSRFHNRGH